MVAKTSVPRTREEWLIYWAIVGTWGVWLIGGLYILAPALGWSLLVVSLARRVGLLEAEASIARRPLPLTCRVWFLGMGTMASGLIVGHLDFGLGPAQILKSFVGWMKGWALMAVFLYIGATMRIRPEIIYRASNILGVQTLFLTPIFIVAAFAHLPQPLYVSPLQIVGGPGPEYFSVELYGIEPETGGARWRFYAPWSPAAAFISNIAFVFALYDKDRRWKTIGVLSALVVCAMTQSRLGLIVVPAVSVAIVALSNITRPILLGSGAVIGTVMVPFLDQISTLIDDAVMRFKNARASSSRVRAVLQSIARHRWQTEAPIWGHGIVEKGPHLVEFMPIGSHHTWNGLLYVKGMVGLISLATPMLWSLGELLLKAQADRVARAALGVLLVLGLYSFGENLEILVYLFWPGIVIIGIASKRRLVSPLHRFLGGKVARL